MDKKILIIEDEKGFAQMVFDTLALKGFKVWVENDGQEGFDKIEEIKPDLILLDVTLPTLNGIEIYKRLLDVTGQPKYPVIVLTAHADMKELFEEVHVENFLAKPVEMQKLFEAVESVFNKKYTDDEEKFLSNIKLKKLAIIDDDKEELDKLTRVLSDYGYNVTPADSPAEGIEKVIANPPALAVVKWDMDELSGDMVILEIKQKLKTIPIECVLYLHHSSDSSYDRRVFSIIMEKTGIKKFLEYTLPTDLLDQVNEVFENLTY